MPDASQNVGIGPFGALRLGVWLDGGLLAGAFYLLTLRENSRSAGVL